MYALSNDQIRRAAPSVFATEAYHAMSDRYAFIPTSNVVDAMRREGFVPVQASQSRTRIEGKREFTKHMIRFRMESTIGVPLERGKELMELVLVNGHDGSSAYKLMAGIFRIVCSNGMIVRSASMGDIAVRHSGNAVDDVIEGSYKIIQDAPRVAQLVDAMKAKPIDVKHQNLFAAAAAVARYGVDEQGNLQGNIRPDQLLQPRRYDDADIHRRPKADVWTTFNVVQENLMKGGLHGRSASGRRSRTRAINSVNENVRLNRDLWSLAEDLLSKTMAA